MGQKLTHRNKFTNNTSQKGAAFAELAIGIVFLVVSLAWAMDAAQRVTELTWMSHSAYLVGVSGAESSGDLRTTKMQAITSVIMNTVNSARFLPAMKNSGITITQDGSDIRAQVHGDTSMAWSLKSNTLNANVYAPLFAMSEGISERLSNPANDQQEDIGYGSQHLYDCCAKPCAARSSTCGSPCYNCVGDSCLARMECE